LIFFHLFFLGLTSNFFLQLKVLMASSGGVFSLSPLEESMMLPKLRSTPDRNSSKQKHDEKTIYRPRVLWGGYIGENLNIETKSQEETGTKTSSGVLTQ
jgi:hypothetical protein